MKQKITIIFSALLLSIPAFSETPHPGPRTKEEPKILYQEGLSSFSNHDYGKASRALQRLVDRYPLDSNFIEAHRTLGESYLKSDQYSKSIDAFKVYIKNHSHDEAGSETRLLLAESYLKSKKYSEARALIEETLKQKVSETIHQQALLMKALTLTRQKKLTDAKASLDAFLTSISDQAQAATKKFLDESLEPKVKFILKTAQCNSIQEPKTSKRKNEELWLNYLQSLKTCFNDSLLESIDKITLEETAEWCATLKSKEASVTRKANDRSFNPKIKEIFDEIKSTAKGKAKELLRCYE